MDFLGARIRHLKFYANRPFLVLVYQVVCLARYVGLIATLPPRQRYIVHNRLRRTKSEGAHETNQKNPNLALTEKSHNEVLAPFLTSWPDNA